jgi:CRP/FNR family cyclic AMP-dependent transcriptional regulator
MYVPNSNLTFPDMHTPNLESIIKEYAVVHEYPAGYVFGKPGEVIAGVYYIKEGRTKHYMLSPDGIEKVLYVLSSGWLFGETPYILHTRTGLYSQTETQSVLYKINSENTDLLLEKSSLFRKALMQCYANKLLILRCEIENLSFNSCKNRIKRLFCASVDLKNSTDPQWYNLKIKYTHYQLGVIVGAARVTISKLIQELCAETFIRVLNRQIQVNRQLYDDYISSINQDWYRKEE